MSDAFRPHSGSIDLPSGHQLRWRKNPSGRRLYALSAPGSPLAIQVWTVRPGLNALHALQTMAWLESRLVEQEEIDEADAQAETVRCGFDEWALIP